LLFAKKATDEPSRQQAAINAPYLLLRAPMLPGGVQLAKASPDNNFNVEKSLYKTDRTEGEINSSWCGW
jgi:hypothetical protein